MKKTTQTIIDRFLAKTPKVIKRIQLMIGVFAGGGASIVATCSYIENLQLPNWLNEFTINCSIASVILMGILQLFTEEENK